MAAGPATASRTTPRASGPRPAPAPGVRARPQLRAARERGGTRAAADAADLHQVPVAASSAPTATVEVATEKVDWEVELVAVIGAPRPRRASDGWAHVAGLTVGQDLSARDVQMARLAAAVQPRQVVPGLRADRPVARHARRAQTRRPRDRVRGQRRDDAARPHVVDALRRRARSSRACRAICPLLPGDLIFTGTPVRRRQPDGPAALPAARRRAREHDRGHRHRSRPGSRELARAHGKRVVIAGGAGGFGSAMADRLRGAGRAVPR